MKRRLGIALGFVLGTGVAHAGGIGGLGGIGLVAIYDQKTHTVCVPGQLDEHMEITRRGSSSSADLTAFYMNNNDFKFLQDVQDTRKTMSVKDENGATRSYRVISGDQTQQVELVDRRAAVRSGER